MPKIIRAAYVSTAATQVNLQPQLPPPPPPQAPLQPFDAVYEAGGRVVGKVETSGVHESGSKEVAFVGA